jgi:serine/threonine protein phosphatase PrpC
MMAMTIVNSPTSDEVDAAKMTTRPLAMSPGHAARSDVGRQRNQNEDRFLAIPPVFVVADGLGGQEAGEVAATIVVELIERALAQGDATRLDTLLETANGAIRDAARGPDRAGMATTCTALRLGDGIAHIAHIGDSRAYRLRAGQLEQLTSDHTLVAQMVREGIVDEAEAEEDDRRHVLTQALGSNRTVRIDALQVDVQPGDRFLLCSDGLSGQVADREIASILTRDGDPGVAADRLVARANAAGGIDNVTVIVVDADAGTRGISAVPPAPARTASTRTVAILAAVSLLVVLLVALAIGALGGAASPSAVPSILPTASVASPAPAVPPPASPPAHGSPPTGGPSSSPPIADPSQ